MLSPIFGVSSHSKRPADPARHFPDCPFHKLELHEIGELPATKMALVVFNVGRFKSRRRLYSGVEV